MKKDNGKGGTKFGLEHEKAAGGGGGEGGVRGEGDRMMEGKSFKDRNRHRDQAA